MKGKAALAVGLGVGYVLGTRDGRARYEQIKTQAGRLWNDPKVQEKTTQAQDLARQKAPEIQEKVSDAAHKAGSRIQRHHDDGGATDATGTGSTTTPADATSTTFGSDGDR